MNALALSSIAANDRTAQPPLRPLAPVPRIAVVTGLGLPVEIAQELEAVGKTQVLTQPPEAYANYDLIVLGPSAVASAPQWVSWFRGTGDWTPIIVFGEHDDSSSRAAVLSAGADDCVSLESSGVEIAARARALLRRAAVSGQRPNHRVEVLVKAATRAVIVGGIEARLTETQFLLFTHLLANAEKWVQSNTLLHVLSTGCHRDSALVRVHVFGTRRKLGAAGWCLQSQPRLGYRVTLQAREWRPRVADTRSPVPIAG